MKNLLPEDIPRGKIVNLPPDEVSLAEALALDEDTIHRLVDLIFSQKDRTAPPS